MACRDQARPGGSKVDIHQSDQGRLGCVPGLVRQLQPPRRAEPSARAPPPRRHPRPGWRWDRRTSTSATRPTSVGVARPPRVAFRRIPLGTVVVPIAHDLVHATTVHTAGQAAHLLNEVMEKLGPRLKFLVVDVAIQGLVQSKTSFAMLSMLHPGSSADHEPPLRREVGTYQARSRMTRASSTPAPPGGPATSSRAPVTISA